MSDRGAVSLVAAAVGGLVAALTLGIVASAQILAVRASASSAADAAALAAAPVTFRPFGSTGSPVDEARRFAEANGASLVACECSQNHSYAARTVVVEVRAEVALLGVREVAATALAAARVPAGCPTAAVSL